MDPTHEHKHGHRLEIFIDSRRHLVGDDEVTGQELRDLVEPPADGIWLDVPDAPDEAIPTNQVVHLHRGMRFFTDRHCTIYLDRVAYRVDPSRLTEVDLRALPDPDVPDNREIWRDVADAQDELVEPGQAIRVTNGSRFFTVPRRINPGAGL